MKKSCGNCHWFLYPELCVEPSRVGAVPKEKVCEQWTPQDKYRRSK